MLPRGGDCSDSYLPPHRDPVILREQVLLQLRKIIDPDLHQDVVSLGFVKDLCIAYENSKVSFTFELTTPACPVKDEFVDKAESLLKDLGWVETVEINLTSRKAQALPGDPNENLAEVGAIVCVASCKGGVGKSSIATNLAFMLRNLGAKVGLVDVDVYGPSLPQLIPLENSQVEFHSYEAEAAQNAKSRPGGLVLAYEEPDRTTTGQTKTEDDDDGDAEPDIIQKRLATGRGGLVPLEYNNVKLMSSGYIRSTTAYKAVRGPLASNLAYQLVSQTLWGELDYLIIDMPPGTGDVHLTLAQSVRITAAVMVTTPQQLSLVDAEKGIHMFNSMDIPTVAIVSNMSYFECPNCQFHSEVFSHTYRRPQTRLGSENTRTDDDRIDGVPGDTADCNGIDTADTETKNNSKTEDPAIYKKGSCEQSLISSDGQKSDGNGIHHQEPKASSYSNVRRLQEQFGVQHCFSLPLHQDLSVLQFPTGYPFVSAFDENHPIWRRFKSMSENLIREISSLRFSSGGAPDVSTTSDGMLQLVLKTDLDKGLLQSAATLPPSERIFHIPLRFVRLSCRCAECVNEYTGASKINARKIPVDIYISKMVQSGNYAVSINWSDGHSSLMSFKLLERLATEAPRSHSGADKRLNKGRVKHACEDHESLLDW